MIIKFENGHNYGTSEISESIMKQNTMYRDIEISEKQIEAGQIKDARAALRETRAKYGL